MKWRVILFETSAGKSPVSEFLASLQPQTIAKFRYQVRLLSEFGPKLAMPHAKAIGDGLFELRVRGKEEVRGLYIFIDGNDVVILHAFKKKSMAIPGRELKIAHRRQRDYLNQK